MDAFFSILDSVVSTPLGLIQLLILSDGYRYSKRMTGWIIATYIGLMLTADAVIVVQGGALTEVKRMIAIANIVGCLLLYFVITKYRDGRMFFCFFSACIFIFISDTISDIVFYSDVFHLVVKVLVFLVIAVLLYRFFKNPFHDILQIVKVEWWWLMLVPFSLCCAIAMVIMVPGPLYEHPEMQLPAMMMCIAAMCVYVAFYMVFKNLQKQHLIEENNHLLKLQVKLLENHAETIQGMSEQMCIYRHDTRHYVRMLAGCLDNHDVESARRMLKQISSELNQPLAIGEFVAYTGAGILDAVLSFYADWAIKQEIAMEIKMEAPPVEKAEITEFSAMLSNGLENAVLECCRLPRGEERSIRLTGRVMQEQYFLEIANTCLGNTEFDRQARPVTREKNHGYGTRSMVDFAERNHGRLEFKVENGWFLVRILM